MIAIKKPYPFEALPVLDADTGVADVRLNFLDPAQAKVANHWTNLVPECARANDHKRELFGELERQAYAINLALAATFEPVARPIF
jgi:hypothetical protein